MGLVQMIFNRDQSRNTAVLFLVVFFLFFCLSLRGLFGTLTLIGTRSGLNDAEVLRLFLTLQAPITPFEYAMLGLNLLSILVTCLVLPFIIRRFRQPNV